MSEPSQAAINFARRTFEEMFGRAVVVDDAEPIAELAITFHAAELTSRAMVAKEREACAQIADDARHADHGNDGRSIRDAIRARGATT